MSEQDDQLTPPGDNDTEQLDEEASVEALETSAPKEPQAPVRKNVGGALLDDLLAVTDQQVAAEVEGVKATIRDREQASHEAKRVETDRRRQELEDLRNKEIDRRQSKIRERQRRQALAAMAADNEPVDAGLEVVAQPRGKGRLVVVIVLVLAVAGGAAWWFFKPPKRTNTSADHSQKNASESSSEQETVHTQPVRVADLDPEESERRSLETSFAPSSIAPGKKAVKPKKRRAWRKKKSGAKKAKSTPKPRRKTRFKRLKDL